MAQVNSATMIHDLTLLLRNLLDDNLTDPKAPRASGEKFVMTSYPDRKLTYPVVTVQIGGMTDTSLGMRSEDTQVNLSWEIRVWARDVKQRDEIADQVYQFLRTFQTGTDEFIDQGLFDFSLDSSTLVDEQGPKGLHSRILEGSFNFVATGG